MQVEDAPNPIESVNDKIGLISVIFIEKINKNTETAAAGIEK